MVKNIISKAIIPSAGMGTRMLPITKIIPKELFPINKKPIIQYSVEEAAGAGIKEICIIISPSKTIIKDYFLTPPEKKMQQNKDIEYISNLIKSITLSFIFQEQPLGLAHAINCAKDFIGKDDFAVLLPDNIYFSEKPYIGMLIDSYRNNKINWIGLTKISGGKEKGFSNCGKSEVVKAGKNEYNIKKIYDKQKSVLNLKSGEEIYRTLGRYIFQNNFFKYYEELTPNNNSELDDVPIIQKLAQQGKLYGRILEGTGFDAGNPVGYFACQKYLHDR